MKIKLIFFLSLLVILLSSSNSNIETFYVIYVKGEIILAYSRKPLLARKVIKANEELIFKQKNAKAVVMSNLRGRFVLQYKKESPAQAEFRAYVREACWPLKINAAVSTRGTPSIIGDFTEYFGDSTFYIIGNRLEFETHRSKYPISENQFFKFSYELGKQKIAKRIENKHNLLLLNRQKIFADSLSVNPNLPKLEVYWLDAKSRSLKKLCSFYPVFIPEEELKQQYEVLFELIKGENLGKKEYEEYIYGYFRDLYGRTDTNVLKSWLEENFK